MSYNVCKAIKKVKTTQDTSVAVAVPARFMLYKFGSIYYKLQKSIT